MVITEKLVGLVAVAPFTMTRTGPVVAPEGTVTLSEVELAALTVAWVLLI